MNAYTWADCWCISYKGTMTITTKVYNYIFYIFTILVGSDFP